MATGTKTRLVFTVLLALFIVTPGNEALAARLTQAQRAAKEQERAHQRQQKQCARYQARLDRINRKLDAGYREPRGNELRAQRRELESQLFRECR